MHYDTWPHTCGCCLLRSRMRHPSSRAAPEQGPARWYSAFEQCCGWRRPGQGVTQGEHSQPLPQQSLSCDTFQPWGNTAPALDPCFVTHKTFPLPSASPVSAWICWGTQHASVRSFTGLLPTDEGMSWPLDSCTGRGSEWSNSQLYFSYCIHDLRNMFPHTQVLSFLVRSSPLWFTIPGKGAATWLWSLLILLFRPFSVPPHSSRTSGQEWYILFRVQLDHSYRTAMLFSCFGFLPFPNFPLKSYLFFW